MFKNCLRFKLDWEHVWNRGGSLLPPFDNNVVQLGTETGRFDKVEEVTEKVDKVEGVAEKVHKVEEEQQAGNTKLQRDQGASRARQSGLFIWVGVRESFQD